MGEVTEQGQAWRLRAPRERPGLGCGNGSGGGTGTFCSVRGTRGVVLGDGLRLEREG